MFFGVKFWDLNKPEVLWLDWCTVLYSVTVQASENQRWGFQTVRTLKLQSPTVFLFFQMHRTSNFEIAGICQRRGWVSYTRSGQTSAGDGCGTLDDHATTTRRLPMEEKQRSFRSHGEEDRFGLALGKRWTWGLWLAGEFCLENPSSCIATSKRPDATSDPDQHRVASHMMLDYSCIRNPAPYFFILF